MIRKRKPRAAGEAARGSVKTSIEHNKSTKIADTAQDFFAVHLLLLPPEPLPPPPTGHPLSLGMPPALWRPLLPLRPHPADVVIMLPGADFPRALQRRLSRRPTLAIFEGVHATGPGAFDGRTLRWAVSGAAEVMAWSLDTWNVPAEAAALSQAALTRGDRAVLVLCDERSEANWVDAIGEHRRPFPKCHLSLVYAAEGGHA